MYQLGLLYCEGETVSIIARVPWPLERMVVVQTFKKSRGFLSGGNPRYPCPSAPSPLRPAPMQKQPLQSQHPTNPLYRAESIV
jgi:hypothetical protein